MTLTSSEIEAAAPEQTRDDPQAPLDKTGREIMVGDVLKVFHFVGARWRKHYFMYKQVVGVRTWPKGHTSLAISHLNLKSVEDRDGGYYLACNGEVHPEIEIVQGLDWHHDRPRAAVARSKETGHEG